jgi:hypothetical protein
VYVSAQGLMSRRFEYKWLNVSRLITIQLWGKQSLPSPGSHFLNDLALDAHVAANWCLNAVVMLFAVLMTT